MTAEAEAAVNALKKLEANKTCVNCGNYNRFGHQHICEKVRTFVCSNCKSAHQSYSMRVKSVSMSNWTMDEVDALREENGGGNAVAARVWYGRWDESQMRKPTKDDALDYYKRCIDRVYNDKAFYDENGFSSGAISSTSSSKKGSEWLMMPAPVINLLDFDIPPQTSKTHDDFGSPCNDEWGDFEAAPALSTSMDEFGAFASALDPTWTADRNGFADVRADVAAASMDLFGEFASAPPAVALTPFDPFANLGGNVVTSNASSSKCAALFDSFAPAAMNQSQHRTAYRMNQSQAATSPKDFSVFDGIVDSSLANGTSIRNKSGQSCDPVKMEMNGLGMHIQSSEGLQHLQQFGGEQHLQQFWRRATPTAFSRLQTATAV
ncbi:unnamed protein product [Peronospora belbahrii]|uniref:Arf-GAP domain-containing protein n=1 Tax=Peronospora belbahrii TaxID=622444 RepID=A0AAU9L5P1_9STRA|nr:unnamed protein product [Peronospora belbahrii]